MILTKERIMDTSKVTTTRLREMKQRSEKIAVLTCYEYGMAKILNEAGMDVLLVGDSLGMVKLGYENTLPVTVDDIVYHCKAVRRGNSRALLIADMPFMSYEASETEAITNAGRIIKEGGAEAVKIEGGKEIASTVEALVCAKIPVMGHIGLTPQSINQLGGYKVQGKNEETAEKLVADAKFLEKAGVFALVLECIPSELAQEISAALAIPTIGIGAGPRCDGQVLVTDDILGLYGDRQPKFVKKYMNLRPQIIDAVKQYCSDVKKSEFPSKEHTY